MDTAIDVVLTGIFVTLIAASVIGLFIGVPYVAYKTLTAKGSPKRLPPFKPPQPPPSPKPIKYYPSY